MRDTNATAPVLRSRKGEAGTNIEVWLLVATIAGAMGAISWSLMAL